MMPNSSSIDLVAGAGQAEIVAQPARRDADALLQASRRLDWRFLLPDPSLGRVAYAGPARGTLVDALRLFSVSLALIAGLHDAAEARYDVVVASDPAFAALRQAAGLVRPGGCLYVEGHGALWPARLRRGIGGRSRGAGPRLRSPAEYVAAIKRLGFGEVEAYWHWPNFESCAEIIPLDDRGALLLALARRHGATGRLQAALGRPLARAGLLARLAPCFSVVACRAA